MTYPGYPMGSADDLESLAEECRALGVQCLTFAADVRDDAAVSAAVQAAADQFGGIDILFNNAGICGYGLAHELTEDAWDAMLDINLKGPWIVARRVIPIMIERPTRRDHQQLVGGRPARHGPALSLRRVEMGAGRPDQVVGHRAGPVQHPRRRPLPDRRQYAR